MPSIKGVSLSQIRGLSSADAARLKAAGVHNTAELLAAAPDAKAERALARKAGVDVAQVREAVNRADLMQVAGLGSATADLFERAGVNSAKELAGRSAAALYQSVNRYAHAHPELHERAPTAARVASLVAGARALAAPTPPAPLTADQAKPVAQAGLAQYLEQVLFGTDPAGASFRSNILDGHSPEETASIKDAYRAAVPGFIANLEDVVPTADGYTFVGRLDGLYTEVDVSKAGQVGRVMVEID